MQVKSMVNPNAYIVNGVVVITVNRASLHENGATDQVVEETLGLLRATGGAFAMALAPVQEEFFKSYFDGKDFCTSGMVYLHTSLFFDLEEDQLCALIAHESHHVRNDIDAIQEKSKNGESFHKNIVMDLQMEVNADKAAHEAGYGEGMLSYLEDAISAEVDPSMDPKLAHAARAAISYRIDMLKSYK